MNALVGYTGFVGSNLYETGIFDRAYNSKNIEQAYGTKPDLLVYAGLRAEKYLANHEPEKDMGLILQAEENITKIAPKKLVLISTIDVFRDPVKTDERTVIDTTDLNAYGLNRYRLERWCRTNFPDTLIIRLPGLYGRNIKKNFIFDFINVIPSMLKEETFQELCGKDPELADFYTPQGNGFRQVTVPDEKTDLLKNKFLRLGFTALNFTDSRSVYQFYDLAGLWADMQTALELDLRLFHTAVEPVSAGELYLYLTGREWINELPARPQYYDYRTVYDSRFGGRNGYIRTKKEVLDGIRKFTASL